MIRCDLTLLAAAKEAAKMMTQARAVKEVGNIVGKGF